MLDAVDLDFFLVALRYTLMEQEVLDNELPRCAKNNIGIIVGGVFNSGITATGAVKNAKYNYREPSADEINKVKQISEICSHYHIPISAVALQFPLAHPMVTSVIPGAFNSSQVKENLENISLSIPRELYVELKMKNLLRQGCSNCA